MSIAVTESTAREGVEQPTPRRTVWGYLAMPAILAAVLVVLWLTVRTRSLDSIEQRLVNGPTLLAAAERHLELTAVSTLAVLAIAIPLGILLTRPFAAKITEPTIAVFNIGQAVPSIGLLVIFALVWDIGFWPAIVALVAYSVLPVLRNTMIGLRQVDASIIEAGRGMGMTNAGVLARIELPLAVPVILTGIRTALVINVGTATLCTFVGAGGLGNIIDGGLVQNRTLVTVTGSVLTAVLALLIDYVAGLVNDALRPRGL